MRLSVPLPLEHDSARAKGLDEQPLPRLDSETLGFRAASESFAPFRNLDHRVLTVGDMPLFGRNRGRHMPSAWIQDGRLAAGVVFA